MKKNLLFASALSLLSIATYAQSGCRIVKDSITTQNVQNPQSSYGSDYTYTAGKLDAMTRWNSMQVAFDSVFYNASGDVLKTISVNFGDTSIYDFVYTSGKLTRVNGSGNRNTVNWVKSYDLVYNGSTLTDINLDQTNLAPNPDNNGDIPGIPGSFNGITWTNGNPVHYTINASMGGQPLVLVVNNTYDSKNNVSKLKAIRGGAEGVMDFMAVNNLHLATAGSALIPMQVAIGDTLALHDYVYNSNNDVETDSTFPYLFDNDSTVTYYTYDCSHVSVKENKAVSKNYIYPNPSENGKFNLHYTSQSGNAITVQVLNSLGQVVEADKYEMYTGDNTVTMNVNVKGLFFVKVIDGAETKTYKVLVK